MSNVIVLATPAYMRVACLAPRPAQRLAALDERQVVLPLHHSGLVAGVEQHPLEGCAAPLLAHLAMALLSS